MNNNLIKKETGFIKRIKDWIKSKFKKTFENGKKVMEITEENEQQSNITIPPDTQLEIDDNSALIPDLPSYFPLEHVDKDWEKKIEKAKKVLYKKLAKYGITKDEWEEIDKYKGSAYFLPTTMLHKVDLYQYNMPRYGGVYDNPDFLEPETIIDSYCKVYSAMCKFGKRNNKDLHICRIDSDLFSDEMRESGQTESLLSFSKESYKFDFAEGKNSLIFLNGILEKGIPCIDITEFTGDPESEVLLPPFLNIDYYDTEELLDGAYPIYNVCISKNNPNILTDEEKENMELLKKSIIDSRIPHEYYTHWYDTITHNPLAQGYDEKSVMLRQEFFKWQENLKKYLQLRFREIENEIDYPKLKPTDFLTWGIERGKQGVEDLKTKMQQVNNLFKEVDNSKENEKDR